MSQVGCDEESIKKLEKSAITNEIFTNSLSTLEKRAMEVVKNYAGMCAEQVKIEKANELRDSHKPQVQHELMCQIEDLQEIFAYEHANIMTNFSNWDRDKNKVRNQEFLGKVSQSFLIPDLEDIFNEVDERAKRKSFKSKSERDAASPTIYLNQDMGEEARKILYNRLNLHIQYVLDDNKRNKKPKKSEETPTRKENEILVLPEI